jgi:hypothetical protein
VKPCARSVGQFAAARLGIAEGDRRFRLVVAQHARHGRLAAVEADLVEALLDLGRVLGLDRDFLGSARNFSVAMRMSSG